MKFLKINIFRFILYFFILCLILWYGTKLIILPDFKQLQLNENRKNVEVLISRMDTNIQNIKKIINDYSEWDDTYLFMQIQDGQYIYDNFREGTSTLEDLDVDFIIYADLDNKVLFSKYTKNFSKSTNIFEKEILDYLTRFNNFYSLYLYKNKPLYLIKSEILKSDQTGIANGHIIAGKFITDERLAKLTNIFSKTSLVIQKQHFRKQEEFSLGNLTKVNVSTKIEDTVTNSFNFTNNEKFLFSIQTTNQKDIINHGKKTVLYFNLVLSSFLFIVFYLLYKNQKAIERYNEELEIKVEEKTKELSELNNNLEEKVKEEVSKNIQKELILFEQSKMANLGAMIGNIAHQWRQPLSIISTIASGIQVKVNLNTLNTKNLNEDMDNIVNKTKYLSESINTFRDFLKEGKEVREFIIEERIDISLKIVGLALRDNSIKLINNIDYSKQTKLVMAVGELTEVIINIINNAKDAALENKIKDPWIKLELKTDNNTATITIEDNAGGIPKDVMPKIFDEYFTTKNEKAGTGLGLHICYKIIKESLKGEIFAQNTDNGAKFFIKLPLNPEQR